MNPLLQKAVLSAVLCSITLMAVRGTVHAEGVPGTDVRSMLSAEAAWKDSIRATANTITTIKPEQGDTYSDLAFLQPILADKRIVSLGEASHGAAEYNLVKVRLIKYLHEKLNYNVIAFESNLADAAAAYTQVKVLKPQQLMENSVYGVWQVEENLPLFEYIAEQNRTDHPLILTGFDSQAVTDSFITFVEQWFSGVDAAKAQAFAQTEEWYVKLNMIDDIGEYTAQKEAIKRKYMIFQTFVKDHAAALSTVHPNQSKLVQTLERVLQNRIDMLEYYHPHIVKLLAGVDQENQVKQGSYQRDRVMAGNVAWLANTMYPGEKLILWGHNYHIRKNNSTMITEHNGFGYDHTPYPTMGEMLPWPLKKDGYVIGLYAYEGSAHKNNGKVEQVMPHDKGSLEEIMGAGAGAAQFINLRDTTLSASTEWMYTPRTAKAWGVLDEKMIPREQYDGILLIRQLQPSTRIKD
ncbi:erythromycin esterase family protein [Paenibacillus sp. FSL R7-0204]|uniref:erythromycin esterase family protein n=1 Tax=Paenibacillus sp. FSL R7-0204 TaxID=2921675 RepID=UPI0030FAB5E6